MTYDIDPTSETVFVRLEGPVTDREVSDALLAMWSDPKFKTSYARFVDATGVTNPQVSTELIGSIARHDAAAQAGSMALVGTSDVVFGMLRMYEQLAADVPCQVFREPGEALRWLQSRSRERDSGT